jgi:hypothetical protein
VKARWPDCDILLYCEILCSWLYRHERFSKPFLLDISQNCEQPDDHAKPLQITVRKNRWLWASLTDLQRIRATLNRAIPRGAETAGNRQNIDERRRTLWKTTGKRIHVQRIRIPFVWLDHWIYSIWRSSLGFPALPGLSEWEMQLKWCRCSWRIQH